MKGFFPLVCSTIITNVAYAFVLVSGAYWVGTENIEDNSAIFTFIFQDPLSLLVRN